MREYILPRIGAAIRTIARTITRGRFIPEAITLGTFATLYFVPLTTVLWKHETAHYDMARRIGNVRYFAGYLWLWVRGGFSYHNHPWERAARLSAGEEE